MEHLDLVLWLLGWPLVYSVSAYLDHLRAGPYSSSVRRVASLVAFVIWFVVAVYLLQL